MKSVLPLIKEGWINGVSHVTGGGFIENLPRMLPEGLSVTVKRGSWDIPGIFTFLEKYGELDREEMYGIFNMGIGMVLAVPSEKEEAVLSNLNRSGEKAFTIGEVHDDKEEAITFE